MSSSALQKELHAHFGELVSITHISRICAMQGLVRQPAPTGKIRIKARLTLVLLHDDQGHPREASTHRGDKHLIMGPSQILARTQEIEGEAAHM